MSAPAPIRSFRRSTARRCRPVSRSTRAPGSSCLRWVDEGCGVIAPHVDRGVIALRGRTMRRRVFAWVPAPRGGDLNEAVFRELGCTGRREQSPLQAIAFLEVVHCEPARLMIGDQIVRRPAEAKEVAAGLD